MKTCKQILALLTLILSTSIGAAPISSLEITGGTFTLLNNLVEPVNPATFANLTIGGYDGKSPDTYGTQEYYAPTSVATFRIGFFGDAAVFTAESDGVRSGYAPVTGDLTNNTLSLDLSSWTFFWNGNLYNMGSSSDLEENSVCWQLSDNVGTINCSTAITTSYDASSGAFTARWDAVHLGYDSLPANGFAGVLSTFEITGFVTAVPVPAAGWLFVSGLIGLIGIAGRQRNK